MFLYIKYIIIGWWNWILDKISDIRYKEEFEERLSIVDKYNLTEDDIRYMIAYKRTSKEV